MVAASVLPATIDINVGIGLSSSKPAMSAPVKAPVPGRGIPINRVSAMYPHFS